MQNQNFLRSKASFSLGKSPEGQVASRKPCIVRRVFSHTSHFKSSLGAAKFSYLSKTSGWSISNLDHVLQSGKIKGVGSVATENPGGLFEEDDDLCPVECVREFKTDEEFCRILEKAKETKSLVVVDFYRTACGSCKYIEQIFAKLCRGSGDQDAPVIFLKHNVIDEYDEQSEVAERLRIKAVPLFHFYKDEVLLEAFPTRDKERIVAAILKYSSLASQDI
ncbi:thioredoxin-like 4 chloroplastic isoform X2 [Tripterygium wilfordii]|uniref:Thioredoxin-like 4, chloroplastic n=1 Tax=Tripterygium wilfordii TaxID=458696 RepID=A0A7J7D2V9_TRIWF|nr:thioredoxin-like 4, chloroplastic [Tripterygium wilfordii]KAF5740682.1 thioredoxin-like 4 chloroplastic isoform X2 [Tripterygium wilfordii]